jgi:hypothetical protein
MRLSLPVERLLLIAGACTSLALACQPAVQIDAVVTARSCTDDARTMKMEFLSNTPVHNFIFQGGSANVLGIPAIQPNGNNTGDTFVITDLANIKNNDKVSVEFKCAVDVHNPMVMQLANVAFIKEPTNLNPTLPDCADSQTPLYVSLWESSPLPGSMPSSPASSLSLEVSDPNPLPITLLRLELAHIPVALDPSLLSEDNPALNALPWQSVIAGGALLDPAGPPLTTQFPNVMADGAVLCRFVSVYDGNEVSGIMQANLSAPLAAKLSTWGGVKSLFRD